jgi:pimeloyl-ACP methyl ester carboxylesterase
MRHPRRLTTIVIAAALSGCLNVDANLFNPDNSIREYLLDDYQGEVQFRPGPEYDIPRGTIHQFTLASQGPKEASATTIHAIYIGDPARIARDTVIMYAHGNRDHMDYYWPRAKLLANVGGKLRFGVLMIDYRGFGLSEGTPTEEGMYADVDAALRWLQQRGLTNDRLIMYGYSLGTASATELTARPRTLRPARLVLESPFASAAVMAQDAAVLAIPPSFLTTHRIANADAIRQVTQPFLWMHGTADDFLRIRTHGEVVFRNYQGERGVAVRVDGAGHGDIPVVMGIPNYLAAVERFITQ